MTRIHLVLLCVLGLAINACEMHPASELPVEHGAEQPGAGSEHATAAEPTAATAHALPHDAQPSTDPKPGDAPKYFPEKK